MLEALNSKHYRVRSIEHPQIGSCPAEQSKCSGICWFKGTRYLRTHDRLRSVAVPRFAVRWPLSWLRCARPSYQISLPVSPLNVVCLASPVLHQPSSFSLTKKFCTKVSLHQNGTTVPLRTGSAGFLRAGVLYLEMLALTRCPSHAGFPAVRRERPVHIDIDRT